MQSVVTGVNGIRYVSPPLGLRDTMRNIVRIEVHYSPGARLFVLLQ